MIFSNASAESGSGGSCLQVLACRALGYFSVDSGSEFLLLTPVPSSRFRTFDKVPGISCILMSLQKYRRYVHDAGVNEEVEILDHIFSFLVSHKRTLRECSRDPVLSPIVERHLYHQVTVDFGDGVLLERYRFSKLVSDNPRIPYYVKILQIQVYLDHSTEDDDILRKHLDDFAKTLLMFPVLECIILETSNKRLCSWPDLFRAALEDRLSLPTLKEVHIVGNQESPCSLIDNRKNIENLFLKISSFRDEHQSCDSTLPQLKSLTLLNSLLPSLKPHIKELRSLKCARSGVDNLPELLGVCSQTLNKLDIDLAYSCYSSIYAFETGKVFDSPSPQLSPIPPNLRQLTIRAPVFVKKARDGNCTLTSTKSYFQAAAKIINAFRFPLQHLILDIDVFLCGFPSNFTKVDFSPLAVLGPASLSCPRIDLYIHTDILPYTATLAQLLSSLEDYEDIMRSIKEGILVIHSEKTAPDYRD